MIHGSMYVKLKRKKNEIAEPALKRWTDASDETSEQL
jgi:hypothetical protein